MGERPLVYVCVRVCVYGRKGITLRHNGSHEPVMVGYKMVAVTMCSVICVSQRSYNNGDM